MLTLKLVLFFFQIIDEKSLIKKYQKEISVLKEELDQVRKGMLGGIHPEEIMTLKQKVSFIHFVYSFSFQLEWCELFWHCMLPSKSAGSEILKFISLIILLNLYFLKTGSLIQLLVLCSSLACLIVGGRTSEYAVKIGRGGRSQGCFDEPNSEANKAYTCFFKKCNS